MISRALSLPLALAASVAVPYVATNGINLGGGGGMTPGASKTSDPGGFALPFGDGTGRALFQDHADDGLGHSRLIPQGPGLYPTQTPLEGIPTYALQEVLRMDVSKEWIYQRWARKSTTTADLEWFGIRVPLVSGAQISDVAGALTYYFDSVGTVQKVTLVGRTGDTSQIVQLATSAFGLTRANAVPGEQLFQGYRDRDVISQLRTRPAPVLWESNPHESFAVDLTIQRLESGRPLGRTDEQLQKLLKQQQQAISEQEQRLAAEAAKKESAAKKTSEAIVTASDKKPESEVWKVFFPRSRVPKPQIESLEKRRILW